MAAEIGPGPRVRAFVALTLPDDHLRTLAAYLEDCRSRAPAFRWVESERMHLTLHFIGHVPAAVLEEVGGRLAELQAEPFRLRLGGLETVGPSRATRVLWLGVSDGREACIELAALVEDACRAAGLERDDHGFRPHVTLARARDRRGAPLPELGDAPPLSAWTVRDFVLFESRLRQSPPAYVPLERYPLI